MKPVRRILVGVRDLEARALPAVRKGAALAEAFGAELVLFHAMAVPVTALPLVYRAGGFRNFERGLKKASTDLLERIAEPLRSDKLKVRVEADWDYPAHEAIVRQTRRIKADLVVAHAHAGLRLAPWLLHLTDWELLRTCPEPVLIVKSNRAWQRPRVLAAIDPVHAFAKPVGLDDEILKAGQQLCKALRGTLHAMHAYVPEMSPQVVGVSPHVIARIARNSEASARLAFERALRTVQVPPSRRHRPWGPPTEAIPRAARGLRAQIVVMGAVSRSGLKRIVIGNTAERILGDLACDVLVVKPQRFVTQVSRSRRGVRFRVTNGLPRVT
ncbi:MAG TPA: universal stress protein [Steroidobacteraceae bacterium]|nr:universal stress protein [Steroidobacteraceae bacterium]